MRKLISQNIKYFIIISLSVFITGGLPLEYGSEKNFFHGYSIQNPVVRVGGIPFRIRSYESGWVIILKISRYQLLRG